MEMELVILTLGIISTISMFFTSYMWFNYKILRLDYSVARHRKDREHQKTMKKLSMKAKKDEKSPDFDKFRDILANIGNEDDLADLMDDYGIPSWLAPIAKGFLSKYIQKGDNEEEDSQTQV